MSANGVPPASKSEIGASSFSTKEAGRVYAAHAQRDSIDSREGKCSFGKVMGAMFATAFFPIWALIAAFKWCARANVGDSYLDILTAPYLPEGASSPYFGKKARSDLRED